MSQYLKQEKPYICTFPLLAVQGVSFDPCSLTYCGTGGGSELETIALQDEALRLLVSAIIGA